MQGADKCFTMKVKVDPKSLWFVYICKFTMREGLVWGKMSVEPNWKISPNKITKVQHFGGKIANVHWPLDFNPKQAHCTVRP